MNAPMGVYLILILASYYAIVVYAPYIGIPWLLIVIYMAIRELRKRRQARKHGPIAQKKRRGSQPRKYGNVRGLKSIIVMRRK